MVHMHVSSVNITYVLYLPSQYRGCYHALRVLSCSYSDHMANNYSKRKIRTSAQVIPGQYTVRCPPSLVLVDPCWASCSCNNTFRWIIVMVYMTSQQSDPCNNVCNTRVVDDSVQENLSQHNLSVTSTHLYSSPASASF